MFFFSLSLSLFPPPPLRPLSSFHISSSFFFNRGDDNLAVIHRVDKRFLFRFLESTPPSPPSYSIESSRILRHRDSNFKRRLSKRVREEEKIPDDEARRKKHQYPLTDTAYIFNILPFRVLGIFPRISAILIRERYMIPSVAPLERWYPSFRPSIKKNYDFTNFIRECPRYIVYYLYRVHVSLSKNSFVTFISIACKATFIFFLHPFSIGEIRGRNGTATGRNSWRVKKEGGERNPDESIRAREKKTSGRQRCNANRAEKKRRKRVDR